MKRDMTPYEGNESYIFVSYCHKDRDFVFPIIEELQKNGCRIWFDRGINPGNDWPDVIAEHLKNCEVFISFLSEQSVSSHNCRREWNYAVAENKPTVPVFIEQVTPTPAMKMQLASLQALIAYELDSKDSCAKKLCGLPALQKCLEEPAAVPAGCRVTYFTEDGKTIIQSGTFEPGSFFTEPSPPDKESDENNTYTFAGWKLLDGTALKDDGACVDSASYAATYSKTPRKSGDSICVDNASYAATCNTIPQKSMEQGFDGIESRTEITNASLIPDDKTRPIVSIGMKPVLIGHNSAVCDYVLDAPLISHEHALIRCDGLICHLRDKSSGNATFVNGERIAPDVEEQVYHDDIIVFGGEKFKLEIPKNPKTRYAKDYRVTFYSDDGSTLISEGNYRLGDIVELPVAPVKSTDEVYRYTFLEWKLLSGTALSKGNVCAGETSYKAVYSKEKIAYTVGYFDENGTKAISSAQYHYGDKINEPAAPEKKADAEYQYTFAGWALFSGKNPGSGNVCLGGATFRATYKKAAREYRVTYYAEDGVTVISSGMYRRGDVIKPPINPPGTMLSEFDGWKLVGGTALKNGKICDGNAEYKAVYRESRTETANGFLVRMKTKEVIPILKELLLGSSPRTGGYAISSSKGICAEHAKIVGRGFQYFLINLSDTNATHVNQVRIAGGEEVRVYHNDTITLGEEDFRLITNDKIQRPQKGTEKKIPYLLLTDSGLKIRIDHTPFELGRNYQKVWTSLKVGRQHATIIFKGEEYYLADFLPYSKNGTFLKGDLLKGSVEYLLHPGDKIRIADVNCKFIVE